MKFLALTLFICLIIAALVSAVPVDESLPGDLNEEGQYNSPQDTQSFFKLKKIKKLLLG